MKYLVNRETKEHKVASEIAAAAMTRYPGFDQDWNIVEADDEGWIPWSGGECPLPDDCKVAVILDERIYDQDRAGDWGWYDDSLTAYRPILSETAEKEEKQLYTEPTKVELLFDRLKSAIAASESIPGIIAEINAMLPDGYCVVQSVQPPTLDLQPAEDMSDWKKWSSGDLLECTRAKQGYLTLKGRYTMADREYGYVCVAKDDSGEEGRFDHDRFRFHSRPAKVAA